MSDKSEENAREIAVLKYKLQDTIDKLDKYHNDIKQQIKDMNLERNRLLYLG